MFGLLVLPKGWYKCLYRTNILFNRLFLYILSTIAKESNKKKLKQNQIIAFVCLFLLHCFISGYYFNNTGLLVCEPFYSKPSHRILATCSLYFPTTMILMYCYGSSFHASSFRLVATPPAVTAVTTPSSTSEKV